MTEAASLPRELPDTPSEATQDPAKVSSADLLRGARELLIQHHGETYRLRLTSNDKLILTK